MGVAEFRAEGIVRLLLAEDGGQRERIGPHNDPLDFFRAKLVLGT
jgi:hypothetical protein